MRAALFASVVLATACVPAARVPMRTLPLAESGAESLVVLLPGRFDDPEDFAKRRFAEIAREEGAPFDLVAVDAHVGYYASRTVVERLEADVIAPARARGYETIWLLGISLGGLGAILHHDLHPGGVDGIFLIAPFLGDAETARAIEEAGGLRLWRPPDGPRDALPLSERIWAAAKALVESGTPVVLAYGTEDHLAPQIRVLGEALPGDRVLAIPGKHDWKPWTQAWSWFSASPPATRANAER